MNSRVYLYLTGGLGNQLFQLAAGLSEALKSGKTVIIDTTLGKPRLTNGTPDLFHFSLPDYVAKYPRGSFWLSRKTSGYILRMGINPRKFETNRLAKRAVNFIAAMVLSAHFRKLVSLRIANNVGFDELDISRTSLLVGYFQSYRYLRNESVKNELRKLKPIETSNLLNHWIKRVNEEKPIFMHFRFQDYLKEKHFGIPSTRYYEESLNIIGIDDRNIWVFSDDPKLARESLPLSIKDRAELIEDNGLTPAELLHLFRFGKDYIIANSSFSWWGASLCFSSTAKVVVPTPWFSGMPEPKDLIWPNWIRVSAHYD